MVGNLNKHFHNQNFISKYMNPAASCMFQQPWIVQNAPPRRKDLLWYKAQLIKRVPSPEYWKILSDFLNGQCEKEKYDDIMEIYLVDNEARRLHNEFIRAIIFNAYFASDPPPGILFPMPTQMPAARKRPGPKKALQNVTRDISLRKLKKIMRSKVKLQKLKYDEQAALCLWNCLVYFMKLILDKTVHKNNAVTINAIMLAFKDDGFLNEFVSKQTFMKFGIGKK